MDDRLARLLYENNILNKVDRVRADVNLLQKLATISSVVMEVPPIPGNELEPVQNILVDTDGTLAANSDERVASQKATKTYADNVSSNASVIAKVLTGFTAAAGTVTATDSILTAFQKVVANITAAIATANAYADSLMIGLWDDRGNFDASVNAYPSSGGSGTAGAILKGDTWTISVAGTLPTGQVVEVGDVVRALVNTPGNTQGNWAIQQNNIGYTAENSANKTGTLAGNESSTVLYATIKGIVDWAKQGLTGVLSTKTTPIDADSVLINDSADSNKTKLTTWANVKATLKAYFDTLYSGLASGPQVKVTTSDQTVSASTLLVDITGLSFSLEASKTYVFSAHIFVIPDETGGFSFSLSASSPTYFFSDVVAVNQNADIIYREAAIAPVFFIEGFTNFAAHLEGTIVTNSATTMKLQFAQVTANGDTTVKRGSRFTVQEAS